MRKDIEIHINTEDIVLGSSVRAKFYPFKWIDKPEGELERYAYGEIELPAQISEAKILHGGLYCEIPYSPIYKEFKIRIKRTYSEDSWTYVTNPADGSQFWTVKVGLYGLNLENAYASELLKIAEGSYYLQFVQGDIQIFSAAQSDFNIIKAGRQNCNLLLKCVPSNSYRYPLTGIGLIRWLNSNIDTTELGQIIKQQFLDDGVTVQQARYDQETNQLYIDAESINSGD